jgi:PleD family two-component response regulator
VVGKPIKIIIPPERQGEKPHILARIRAGDRIDHFGTVRITKVGRRLHSVDEGATFVVVLPLSVAHEDEDDATRRAHPKAPSSTIEASEPVDFSGVRVLVVDDEPDARLLIARILETCHAQVRAVASVSEALEAINL